MRDTIGAHLKEALLAERQAAHFDNKAMMSPSRSETWLTYAAEFKGAAAGHAFRAAELAHDLGFSNALTPEARRVIKDLRSTLDELNGLCPQEMAVHWNGDE